MPCSAKFSMTLQTETLSTIISDFLETNGYSQVILFRDLRFFCFFFFCLFFFGLKIYYKTMSDTTLN